MSLKVTAIDLIVVDVPFTPRQQQITARTVFNWGVLELCRVSTDAGIVGWGETVIHYTYARVTEAAVQRVIGRSPAACLTDDTLGAGLQMALYDVVGKALGVPCSRLMGNRVRDWVPISWWSNEASSEDWAEEARDAVRQGYTSIKLKQRPWRDIVEQVETVTAATPSFFKLDLDANGSMQNAAAAMPVMRRLEEFDQVAMFETPIPQTDILGNQQLRQVICRPIAMHFGSPPYVTVVREAVCDGFVVGGGATQVLREGTLSAEANMPFWLQLVGAGLTTVWASHLGAVLSHASWPAISCLNLYSHSLLTSPIEVIGGCHHAPEAPGLGVSVDEEAVARYAVPEETIRALRARGAWYDRPRPRIVRTAVYPDGSRVHMANVSQGMDLAPYTPGVRLETWADDGSEAWNDLWKRVQTAPVRSLSA
ncbi:MAG: enolase [candidate division Zixibacteria bacterium]|nr:enolase [candidate division Zixibacteria bacterium]